MPSKELEPMENQSRQNIKRWIVSILLILPMVAVYSVHFGMAPEASSPTGFLQYDQFYYMANAREHFDNGAFSISYGLPFSPDYETPRNYFQPLSLMLGTIFHFTGWPPGYIYSIFGLLAALVCVRVSIALYAELVGLESKAEWFGLIFFLWGGGLLAVAGIASSFFLPSSTTEAAWYSLKTVFRFDPFEGYWFLNFGRNLFYSTEAFYHAIFLTSVFTIFKKRYVLACLLLGFMSISHPFTGLQLLLVVFSWSVAEHLLGRKKAPPISFVATVFVLIGLHISYYLLFLNTSPEHRILQNQWSEAWTFPLESQLLAYSPLLLLACWAFWKDKTGMLLLKDSRLLFLFCWVLVSFSLTNHEILVQPRQPLHFTRGYVWIPLFLLTARQITALINLVLENRNRFACTLIMCIMTIFILLDNSLWFGSQLYSAISGEKSLGFYQSASDKEVLHLMNEPEYQQSLVISSDHLLGYTATIYSPLRSWASHGYNTPDYPQRVQDIRYFFEQGRIRDEWLGRPLFVISLSHLDRQWQSNLLGLGLKVRLKNEQYTVYTGTVFADETHSP